MLSEAALQAGAGVRSGVTVASFRQDADGVDVELTDSTGGRYDLLVGADGLRSEIRRKLLGDESPEPRFLGEIVWRALLERPASVTGLFQFYGPTHKTGFTPLTPERMYMFLVEPSERAVPDPAERPALMRELLQDFGGIVAEVRETIRNPDQVDARPLDALLVPPPWYRGRVALIGDAAHATTPQLAMGAALALEDAIVLADELAAGDDVGAALKRFMARRYERCRMVVENSVQLAEWEKSAAEHGEDAGRLQAESIAALAAPI